MKALITAVLFCLVLNSSPFAADRYQREDSSHRSFSDVFLRQDGSLKLARLFRKLFKSQEFESHINPDQFYGTYLISKVNFIPVNRVKETIEKIMGLELQDRGEAHITVITPPEHDAILASVAEFSMEKVEELVRNTIQNLRWDTLGVGASRGKNGKGQYSEVYFLVVNSPQLRFIRERVARYFNIPRDVFDPARQDFHVTIGFTESDLFGIPKDETSLEESLRFDKHFKAGL